MINRLPDDSIAPPLLETEVVRLFSKTPLTIVAPSVAVPTRSSAPALPLVAVLLMNVTSVRVARPDTYAPPPAVPVLLMKDEWSMVESPMMYAAPPTLLAVLFSNHELAIVVASCSTRAPP